MRSTAVRSLPALCLVCASLVALPASAEIGKGNGEIGFDLGWSEFDDEDVADETGWRNAVRFGYLFTDRFELEAQLARAEGDRQLGAEITLDTVFVNALVNFRAGERLVPYLLVGVGSAKLELDAPGLRVDDSDTAYQAALGGRVYTRSGGRFALRIEAGYLWEGTFDETSEHLSIAAGAVWRLGGGR